MINEQYTLDVSRDVRGGKTILVIEDTINNKSLVLESPNAKAKGVRPLAFLESFIRAAYGTPRDPGPQPESVVEHAGGPDASPPSPDVRAPDEDDQQAPEERPDDDGPATILGVPVQ